MIIGISGTPSSGKDTFAEYLEQQGFVNLSLSAILREVLTEEGVEINLPNLTKRGNEIGLELVKRALKRIPQNQDVIISSIRQKEEVELLKQREDFFMVFVEADAQVRYERLKLRARKGDSETFEEFEQIEAKQTDGKSGVMNLEACKEMADYVIENNGTLDEFLNNIKNILDKIKKRCADE